MLAIAGLVAALVLAMIPVVQRLDDRGVVPAAAEPAPNPAGDGSASAPGAPTVPAAPEPEPAAETREATLARDGIVVDAVDVTPAGPPPVDPYAFPGGAALSAEVLGRTLVGLHIEWQPMPGNTAGYHVSCSLTAPGPEWMRATAEFYEVLTAHRFSEQLETTTAGSSAWFVDPLPYAGATYTCSVTALAPEAAGASLSTTVVAWPTAMGPLFDGGAAPVIVGTMQVGGIVLFDVEDADGDPASSAATIRCIGVDSGIVQTGVPGDPFAIVGGLSIAESHNCRAYTLGSAGSDPVEVTLTVQQPMPPALDDAVVAFADHGWIVIGATVAAGTAPGIVVSAAAQCSETATGRSVTRGTGDNATGAAQTLWVVLGPLGAGEWTCDVGQVNEHGLGPMTTLAPVALSPPFVPPTEVAYAGRTGVRGSVRFRPGADWMAYGGAKSATVSCTSPFMTPVAVGNPGPVTPVGGGLYEIAFDVDFGTDYVCDVALTMEPGGTLPGRFGAPIAFVTEPGMPPGLPSFIVSVTAESELTIDITAPVVTGDAPVATYDVECSRPGDARTATVTAPATVAVISGFTFGQTYTCRVRAVSSAGTGAWQSAAPTYVPRPPLTPTAAAAVAAGPAEITFSATAGSPGDGPITHFAYTCSRPDQPNRTGTFATSPATHKGFVGGYWACEIRAVNAYGSSPARAAGTAEVVAPTAPDAPGLTAENSGPGDITLTVTAPATDGGFDVTDYDYSCTAGVATVSASFSDPGPVVVSGLTAGATYSCSVTATNVIGTSAPSSVATVYVNRPPDAPSLSATQTGWDEIQFTVTPGASDLPVTHFAFACFGDDGDTRAGQSAIGFSGGHAGFTAGVTWTCTVTVISAAGESDPSNAVVVFVDPAWTPDE